MQAPAAAIALMNVATLLFCVLGAAIPALARTAPSSSSFRLYKSQDHGASWFEVGKGLPGSKRIHALVVAGGVAFAGTDAGVFVSSDAGRTWSASPITPTPRVQCFAVAGRHVYAGTSSAGVLVTTDGGRSWLPVVRGLPDPNIRSLATHGDSVYAGTDSRGVFLRAGGAEEWKPLGRGLPEHSQVFDLAVGDGRLHAALYSKGLYRIELGGGRWTKLGDVRPLELLARGDVLVAGHNPGGIHRSLDGGATWKPAGGLPGGPPIWVLGESGPNMLAGTSPGAVAISADLGGSWTRGVAGLPRDAAVVAIADGGDHTLAAIVLPDP